MAKLILTVDQTVLFNKKLVLDIVDAKKDLDDSQMRMEFYLRFLLDLLDEEEFDQNKIKTFVQEQC